MLLRGGRRLALRFLPGTATELLEHARDLVDPYGFVRPVCGAPRFDRSGTSVEAQAFFLLASAAARRQG